MRRRDFIKAAAIGFPSILVPRALANPFGPVLSGRVEAGGASCTTARDSRSGTTNGSSAIGDVTQRTYVATQFTAAANATICRIVLPLFKTGSPTFNLFASIYSDDSGETDPNAILGSESSAVAASGLTSGAPPADVEFLPSSGDFGSVVSGTRYWVVVRVSAVGDGSNFASWDRISVALTNGVVSSQTGSGTWLNVSNTRANKFSLFST